MNADVLNTLAGLGPESELAAIRARRPEFVDGAENCRAAVIEPKVDVGLGLPLRSALAARMARLNGDERLAAHYRAGMPGDDAELVLIADGGFPQGADRRLRAILRHVDFITVAPRACTRSDTERLVTEGLTVPEVVALAELIGFLNFEVRILATLDLLRDTP